MVLGYTLYLKTHSDIPGATRCSNTAKQSTKTKTRNRKNRIRQRIVQVSVRKYWEYLTENLVRGTTRPKLDSRSLGRCPWPDLGRLLLGLRGRLREQSWYPKTNTLTQRGKNQKSSSAETARPAWVPTGTGRTKGQPSGDCSTSFGHSTKKGRQSTLDTAWLRGAESVVM